MEEILKILNQLNKEPWERFDFWLNLVIGLGGLYISWSAFKEARKAKEAATIAARNVKSQTISIELTQIIERLGKIESDIKYEKARELVNEINSRILRLVKQFETDTAYSGQINTIKNSLQEIRKALEGVRPFEHGTEIQTHSIFYAIETNLSDLSSHLATLAGIFDGDNMGLKKL